MATRDSIRSVSTASIHDRSALGAVDVSDDELRGMVAAAVDREVDAVEIVDSRADEVPYDIPSITTAGRWWVHGHAAVGGTTVPFRFFVKAVQSWSRSPFFAFVPAEMQEMAEASVPWRTEPLVYRSDLATRLPAGLAMPRAFGVFDLDEASAAMWLEDVASDTPARVWDLDRYGAAAHLLGRLAASPAVAEHADVGRHAWTVYDYLYGRLDNSVFPALRDDSTWQHPLIAPTFDAELRARILGAIDRAPDHVAELTSLPLVTGHGDACPNNLLDRPDGADGFVLIDFGFWGPRPVGFDLGQLLCGEAQLGRCRTADLPTIEAVIVDAYVDGLRSEGCDVPAAVARRAHALQVLLFTGVSALPFEHLDREPTDELLGLAAERARLARFCLDLVDVVG